MTKNEPSTRRDFFTPLNQLGIVQVAGEDAQRFLQNLLTNDVNALAINQSQLSGFCNAKGRLFAVFVLIRRQASYQLVLPKTMSAALQQRLSMYVLRSKVTVTDVSDDFTCLGLLPESAEHINALNDDNIIPYPSDPARFLYIGSNEQTAECVANLTAQHWQLATDERWELSDIAAGLPMIYPETKEKFTPQQVNLDLVNGVSFSKGCYPGQEVVARLHYLGTPSRRLFQAKAHTAKPTNIGDEITTENGDIAGQIVRIHRDKNDDLHLLTSLKLIALESELFIHQTIAMTLLTKNIAE